MLRGQNMEGTQLCVKLKFGVDKQKRVDARLIQTRLVVQIW